MSVYGVGFSQKTRTEKPQEVIAINQQKKALIEKSGGIAKTVQLGKMTIYLLNDNSVIQVSDYTEDPKTKIDHYVVTHYNPTDRTKPYDGNSDSFYENYFSSFISGQTNSLENEANIVRISTGDSLYDCTVQVTSGKKENGKIKDGSATIFPKVCAPVKQS